MITKTSKLLYNSIRKSFFFRHTQGQMIDGSVSYCKDYNWAMASGLVDVGECLYNTYTNEYVYNFDQVVDGGLYIARAKVLCVSDIKELTDLVKGQLSANVTEMSFTLINSSTGKISSEWDAFFYDSDNHIVSLVKIDYIMNHEKIEEARHNRTHFKEHLLKQRTQIITRDLKVQCFVGGKVFADEIVQQAYMSDLHVIVPHKDTYKVHLSPHGIRSV